MSLSEQKNLQVPDYEKYVFTRSEFIRYLLFSFLIIIGVALICYDNILFTILLVPFVPYYIVTKKRSLKEERRWRLNIQFCDGINCISAALESGYSIENAVKEAYHDLRLTYTEKDVIMQEMKLITVSLGNNMTIEEAFTNLAERSGLEDVRSFADIFATAKRTGGNIMAIIKSTADIIHTRVELKRELKTVIASKKFEADLMKLIPFAMLVYLKIFSPDMVAALYGNTFGVIFMTVILAIYLLLCRISDYLIKIEL